MTDTDGTARPRIAGAFTVVLIFVAACSSKLVTNPDANVPRTDGPVDLSGVLLQAPCGGTVSLRGTTPNGPFNGDVVSLYGFYGQYPGVGASIADSQTGLGIDWTYDWPVGDAGAVLTPESAPVNGKFLIDHGTSELSAAGRVDITSATNPASVADAGVGGAFAATMTFSQTGFALSGSLSSPYCRVFDQDSSQFNEHR
jgi:hypothetical protein